MSYRAASGVAAGLHMLKKRFVFVKLTLRCSARLHESNLVSYLPGPGELSLSCKFEDVASRVGEGDLFVFENRGVPMLMELMGWIDLFLVWNLGLCFYPITSRTPF